MFPLKPVRDGNTHSLLKVLPLFSIRMFSIRMFSIRMFSIRMFSIRMFGPLAVKVGWGPVILPYTLLAQTQRKIPNIFKVAYSNLYIWENSNLYIWENYLIYKFESATSKFF